MEEDLIAKKAELILGGPVLVPEGFEAPSRISQSTAGPGAGYGSLAFSFGRFRVKKPISRDTGDFELVVGADGYSLTRGGEPFLDRVGIVPIVRHCPEQAFFNLDKRCIYNCAYCTSPHLDRVSVETRTADDIVRMVGESLRECKVVAVSLTSGVVGSVDETVDRFVECVSAVHEAYPQLPIGVEPYVSTREQLVRLREAGADEIKINLETATDAVFRRTCPELNRSLAKRMVREAVGIFGRGKVSSNIIFGLGETDAEIEACMEELCAVGAVPTLRALSINDINRERIRAAVGDLPAVGTERVLRLARMHKEVLERHGLDTLGFRTMCLECTCCDIVPFRDLL
ncbi:MAG: radical SAM protein [Euryarchaeota archaeon]|nr:radical SAM protein [Euryarchaeota archaeon]